jgi:hypothetical protein
LPHAQRIEYRLVAGVNHHGMCRRIAVLLGQDREIGDLEKLAAAERLCK